MNIQYEQYFNVAAGQDNHMCDIYDVVFIYVV